VTHLLLDWQPFRHVPGNLATVVRMAVQHTQLQAVAPFAAASGRAGCRLSVLGLVKGGVLDQPNRNLSRALRHSRGSYARFFARVASHGEWEPWLLYMLKATEVASIWSSQKIRNKIVVKRKYLDLLGSDEHSGLPYPVSDPCAAAAPSGAP